METETILPDLRLILRSKDSPLHQQAEIILNSLLEASELPINSANIPTYLFASLYAWLRKSLHSPSETTEKALESGLFLLNLLLPKLNLAITQAKHREISDISERISTSFSKNPLISRYSVAIACQLLQVLPRNEWISPDGAAKSLFSRVFSAFLSGNSQSRRQISKSFAVLLDRADVYPQSNGFLREFALKCLENEGREALLITPFLSALLQKLQTPVVGDVVYCYMRLLAKITDNLLITHIYLCLEALMSKSAIGFELAESLLKELLRNQPSFYTDEKLVFAYVQCLAQTLINLLNSQFSQAKRLISPVFSTISEVLLVEKPQLVGFAQKTLEMVLLSALKTPLWQESQANAGILEEIPEFEELLDLETSDFQEKLTKTRATDFQKLVVSLKHLLSSRFSRVSAEVFAVLRTFFEKVEALDLKTHASLRNLIEMLAISRKNDASLHKFNACFLKVATKWGLQRVLEVVPLSFRGDVLDEGFENENNLWLLSLNLQKNLSNEPLELFFGSFERILGEIREKSRETDPIRAKVLQNLEERVWDLLPCFCFGKSSFSRDFPRVIAILDEFLEKSEKIREKPVVSLLKLVNNLRKDASFSGISLENASFVEKTVPKLVKLVNFPQTSEISRVSLRTIRTLATFCGKAYLDRVFARNAASLLEIPAGSEDKSLKTFEILLAVAESVDIRSENYEFCLKLVKKFINIPSFLQKRAYKLLLIVLAKVHESHHVSLINLLPNSTETLQPGSKPTRLLILRRLWGNCAGDHEKGEFLQRFLAEIVVALKENKAKSRKLAGNLLKSLSFDMHSQGLLKEFLNLLCAGLAGVSSAMKSATLWAFSKVFEEFLAEIAEDFVEETVKLASLLVNEGNKEVFQAFCGIIKVLLRKAGKMLWEKLISLVLGTLLKENEGICEHFRASINHLLRKLIKTLGKEAVQRNLPEGKENIVKLVLKSQKHEKKREKSLRIRRKKLRKEREKGEKSKDFEEKDAEMMMNEELAQKKQRKLREIEENPNDLLLKYDANTEKFHFVEHPLAKIKEKAREDEKKAQLLDLQVKSGKIVVNSEETGKKRKRNEENEEKPEVFGKKEAKLREKMGHLVKESGETFRNKEMKAHGDLLIAGKPNPYAFIQLNPQVLNKRKRNLAGKAFEKVLGKKHEDGALKGLKSSKKVKI